MREQEAPTKKPASGISSYLKPVFCFTLILSHIHMYERRMRRTAKRIVQSMLYLMT